MKKALSLCKLTLLVCIILGLPLYVYFLHPEWIEQVNSLEKVHLLLAHYKTASVFAYLGLQIGQVVISILPGQVLQLAGGYAYGFGLGFLFTAIGVTIGTAAAFGLSRFLGRDAVHFLFGEEKVTRFVNQLNSKRAFAILLVLYAIPGLPKDVVTYAAGISNFRFRTFLLLSVLARSPAMMGSVLMGVLLREGDSTGLVFFVIGAVLLCILLFFFRHRLTHQIDHWYQNLITPKEHHR